MNIQQVSMARPQNETYFSYIGRPDGIGNRIEEIILLELICTQYNKCCEYIWLNKQRRRTYPIHLKGKNVQITTKKKPSYNILTLKDFNIEKHQQNILRAANKIKPLFNINFDNCLSPIGVHIRASDRIGVDHPHFMKDENELKSYMSITIKFLNQSKPEHIFVCSEDKRIRDIFLTYIDKSINIIIPHSDKNIPREYIDFFALSLCKEVWMVSRFSTFSITAALIGNIPLISFVRDRDVYDRYLALFEYRAVKKDTILIQENLCKNNLLSTIRNMFS